MKPSTQLDLLHGLPLKDSASFREDRQIMMLPFFTLGRKPVHEGQERRWIERETGQEYYIRNSPGEDGLPTMWDKDILTYVETQLMEAMNRGEPVSPRIRFHVHDCLASIRRGQGGREYELFHQSLKRLKGTTVFTNVTSADTVEDGGFGWLQSFRIQRRKLASGKEVMASCEVTICDWLFNSIVVEKRALALDAEYFNIESGLERKLYQIIRAHLGVKESWNIGLDRLYDKTGSTSARKRFNYEIRQIVERDPFPQWAIYLTTDGRLPAAHNLPVPAKGASRKPMYLVVVKRGSLRAIPRAVR